MDKTEKQLDDAIDREAKDWAQFFDVEDEQHIEARRMVMRANAKVGYLKPLKDYLPSDYPG